MTMWKALCYGLLVRQPYRTTMSSSSRRYLSTVDPSLLAQDWSQQLISVDGSNHNLRAAIVQATTQTLPLLEDVSSVPFVCRYRTEVIKPLTTRQVFELHTLKQKHASLAILRTKLLDCIIADENNDSALLQRIQTSTSKSELQDLYAPYKPPSKGSILERIQKELASITLHHSINSRLIDIQETALPQFDHEDRLNPPTRHFAIGQ